MQKAEIVGDYNCNHKQLQTTATQSKLTCYYKNDRPFLRIAPIKVERLNMEPEVLLFKQVLTDSEIDLLKRISGPNVRTNDFYCFKAVIQQTQTFSAASRARGKHKEGRRLRGIKH